MRKLTNRRLPFLLVCAALTVAVIGCSNNSNTNPADQMLGTSGRLAANGIALSANPERIVIDPDDPNTPTDPNNGNKQYGETVLTVVATDEGGSPQADLAITFGAAAGSIEGMIYTIIPTSIINYVEVVPQAFLLSAILFYWVNHPEKKWLNWVLGIFFVLVMLMSALGVMAANGMLQVPA